MDQVQLETFITIAQEKSYSKAAAILNVTQPTVTARIKNLEGELYCELFKRIGREIMLTDEGHVFLEYANSILTYMNHSKEVTKSAKFPIIRIGFTPGYSYDFITKVIQTVTDLGDLGITVVEGDDSVKLNEQIQAGDFDVVFTRNVLSYKPEITSEYLFDNRLVGIVGKDHPFAKKEMLTLADFTDETLIGYRRNTQLWTEIEQQLIGIPNVKRIEVGNNEMLKNVVGTGLGIGITPFLGINSKIDTNVVIKDIEGINKIQNKVYVQYRNSSLIAQPIKQIIYSIINHEMDNSNPFHEYTS